VKLAFAIPPSVNVYALDKFAARFAPLSAAICPFRCRPNYSTFGVTFYNATFFHRHPGGPHHTTQPTTTAYTRLDIIKRTANNFSAIPYRTQTIPSRSAS
jgi:hypothetical protein